MFDVNQIAKKIKTARTNKNMTQMDLADAMGISYQAVSNWERGNSMPDIAKLPELCQILELDIDELLGTSSTSQTVKRMISDDDATITLEELADVVPIISPQKFEKIIEENHETIDSIDIEALVTLAPFLDADYLSELAEKLSLNHMEQLIGLAPFM